MIYITIFLITTIFNCYAESHNTCNRTERITFHSQASQDKFVYLMLYGLLDKQDEGYYLEIGAWEPIHHNNTYVLENDLNWKGVSIDIAEEWEGPWSTTRNNPLLIADALTANYDAILQSYPKVIDYLSLDVDGAYTDVLRKIPFHNYIFKVVTIEHDMYRFGTVHRDQERAFLAPLGYHLLCSEVSAVKGAPFEDWWIHPSCFSPSEFAAITALDLNGKDHSEVIRTLYPVCAKVNNSRWHSRQSRAKSIQRFVPIPKNRK